MDIAIVIPVRNREAIVGRTLDSVASQTYRPLSVILVDNGSVDGSRRVMEQWAQKVNAKDFKVTIVDEPAPGAANARNAGLAAVNADWTMFFDSDDVMLPEHVERAMKCAEKHPNAQLIGWDVDMALRNGSAKRGQFFSSDMHYNNIIHGGFATLRYMAKTDLFRKAGGWNAAIRVWDDIELGARLLSLRPAPVMFKVNGKPTVHTFFTEDSITGKSWSGKADALCEDIDSLERLLPKNLRWIANLKRGQLARVCLKEGRPDAAKRALGHISGSKWHRAVCRLAAYLPTDFLRPMF